MSGDFELDALVRCFKSLKGEFQEAAGRGRLYNCLYHFAGDAERMPWHPRPKFESHYPDIANHPLGLARSDTVLHYRYFGDRDQLILFDNLARRAGECWSGLMKVTSVGVGQPISDGLPVEWEYSDLVQRRESLRVNFGIKERMVFLWVLVLHGLGWRPAGSTTVVSTRLYKARRTIWNAKSDKGTPLPCEVSFYPDERPEELEGYSSEISSRLSGLEITDHFLSELSVDVFTCSTYAIDLLLERHATGADDHLPSPEGSDPSYLGMTLDLLGRRLMMEGCKPVMIKGQSFKLLELLIRNRSNISHHEYLINEMFAGSDEKSRAHLRRLISDTRSQMHELSKYIDIKSIRGEGYVLDRKDPS